MIKACQDCVHSSVGTFNWVEMRPGLTCRRYAPANLLAIMGPTLTDDDRRRLTTATWPQVQPTDWCSEFVPKAKVEQPQTHDYIGELKRLTSDQDLKAIEKFMGTNYVVRAFTSGYRSTWYETLTKDADERSTTVSEQLVVMQQEADRMNGTSYANMLAAQLLSFADVDQLESANREEQ